ncbi:ActS/PrrB/RegB family redox-sensitive histidine kinase [Candidatus Odyssella thessalonicensis]|uniref:ActS/PrrB/RegB family redox-sensitive histidine kinase n=1 Tax=Candidatus Odyssella thessalonicensis TaxID=84647 RepID=UPI000225C1AD|nr:ActS/PrrB/RegB family redox-sensitive histidine kinase [Candidatus Odyssella thessalonicensis]
MQSYSVSHLRAGISFALLVSLRWIALAGQSATLLLIDHGFHIRYPKVLTWSLIGLSVMVNFVLTLTHRVKPKIPASQLCYYLIYDIGQLAALLYVTGGLNNPFAVFLLAPVIIAAGFARRRDATVVTLFGLLATVTLYTSAFPLPWFEAGLVLPELLRFAVLVAISCAMIFIAIYVSKVASDHLKTMQALQVTELALAREQKLASLGALAAAAAHELGSPLTTVILVIREMKKETLLPDHLKEDIQTLDDQTTRCREILQGLSRNFREDHVLPFKMLPLEAALNVIINNHGVPPGKHIRIICAAEAPLINLSPELQHALGNVIANALQFADAQVLVTCGWSQEKLTLKIADDGPGFPEFVLARIGQPYVSSRKDATDGIHLGLGLFIAQTLIEKKGGMMYFYNKNGAVCEINLPRKAVEVTHENPGQ